MLWMYFIQVDFLESTVGKDQEIKVQRETDLIPSSFL